ncbi:MAG: hypothetical protein IJY39_02505 [Clostridia bacterium]|nr:hypothetical protein [Clostridia bacterium]MBQ9785194.1 hypothetical protein [Clostridia bacterium]
MAKNQVTQAKNPELESFQNSHVKLRKTRFFSLMTYANKAQIMKVMKAHVNSVRAFCFILHDKDEATPHIHIILRTHSTWTCSGVVKWFGGLMDDKKQPINTFCEVANDLVALKEYLTHSDQESREKGKHEYSDLEIEDFGVWDLVPKNESYDDSYEILNEVLIGTPYRTLVRRYGRKFLYHWETYANMAREIRQAQGYKEAKMQALIEIYGIPKEEIKPEDLEDYVP